MTASGKGPFEMLWWQMPNACLRTYLRTCLYTCLLNTHNMIVNTLRQRMCHDDSYVNGNEGVMVTDTL